MLICHCHAVTDRQIRAAVLGGAQTVGKVGRATQAGSCCGGCVPAIAEIVERNRPLPMVSSEAVGNAQAAAE